MVKDQDFGQNIKGLFKKLNHDTQLSKMLPICAVKDLSRSCKIYGRSGTMRNGILYQLAELVPYTVENVYGLLPTPCARDYKDQGRTEMLAKFAHKRKLVPVIAERLLKGELFPTPTTFDAGGPLPPRKKNKSGGQKPPLVSVICSDKSFRLNPQFVEAMMGFPKDWTMVGDKE